jgi:hypothetical protein
VGSKRKTQSRKNLRRLAALKGWRTRRRKAAARAAAARKGAKTRARNRAAAQAQSPEVAAILRFYRKWFATERRERIEVFPFPEEEHTETNPGGGPGAAPPLQFFSGDSYYALPRLFGTPRNVLQIRIRRNSDLLEVDRLNMRPRRTTWADVLRSARDVWASYDTDYSPFLYGRPISESAYEVPANERRPEVGPRRRKRKPKP